jgi:outer membrane protein assembly factor BamB
MAVIPFSLVTLVLAGLPTTQPATQPVPNAWPMWGGSPARNAVAPPQPQDGLAILAATEGGRDARPTQMPTPSSGVIPTRWDVEKKENIRWAARLGTQTYGGPVVAGGKVFVGTNNGSELRPGITGDKGCVLCFEEKTGKLLWQATHDKLASGSANDWPEQGVASTPLVDGDRVYYVSNRCELVCADVAGFRDVTNDGPFKDEQYTTEQDADFIWILDMIGQLGVYPHNLAACSPAGFGGLIFVCTSNGVDEEHEKPPAPDAPSFIAVDKKTGRVVWQRNDPDGRILHGQWSSPAYARIGGQAQVIFAGGDGWCYAFGPATGAPLWKFNLNPKDAVWESGGGGTKSSIVATPVVCDEKVFLAVGDDPETQRGPGHLYAIDATQRGDVTATAKLWHVGGKEFGRTIASAAVADGLVYAVDLDGYLSCFDERTGQRHWRYDMQAAVWGSPCIVDGKVLLGNADGDLVVLQHGPTLKELARNEMHSPIYTSVAVANGVLYIATQRFLYAIQAPEDEHAKTTSD